MTSKGSFEDTATYWTQIYAGGPGPKEKKGKGVAAADTRDEVAIAGLEKAHVDRFETLGFQRSKVVRLDPQFSLPCFEVADICYSDRRPTALKLSWSQCLQDIR
jgi:Fungal ubiquitin-associated domain